jgi:hypothetical protein
LDRHANCIDHAVGLLKHIVVPKPEDPITDRLEFSGALQVGFPGQSMVTTVDLNDQPSGLTGEIDDVIPNGHLAAKAQAVELMSANPHPQALFGVGHACAQHASLLDRFPR